jgi:DNA-binding GntR family transcriptional regulator
MDSPVLTQTKSSRVYGELKREITAGRLMPGEHLVRRDLVKRFGVSLSIINEALGRLNNDGLVETTEMIGTRVLSLSEESLRDEFALREAIERHVARLLSEKATDELLAILLEDARTLDRWMNELGHDEGQGSLLHLEFHLKLARSTGFASLEENLKRMGMRALLTTRWLKNQRLPHPADFHQQLVRALQRRDPVLADRTMRDHLHYAIEYRARHGTTPETPLS